MSMRNCEKCLENSMNEEDVIYKDNDYTIIKKDSNDIGVIIPLACLDIIEIATKQLSEWENGGFANKKDYSKIIEGVCDKLKSTIK